MYSPQVLDHFQNPRNAGDMENPDAEATVGNPSCGDLMTLYLKIENDRITDIKFKTFGCGAAIACSSATTEMVKGKTIDEALQIERDQVANSLGGLPPVKMHCSNLAVEALRKAIESYRQKNS